MSEQVNRHTEATTTAEDPDCELFPFGALLDNGLVWALNRHLLHPRGLALGLFTADGDDEPSGWQVVRADDGIWQFDPDLDRAGQAKFVAFMEYVERRAALGDTPPPRPPSFGQLHEAQGRAAAPLVEPPSPPEHDDHSWANHPGPDLLIEAMEDAEDDARVIGEEPNQP